MDIELLAPTNRRVDLAETLDQLKSQEPLRFFDELSLSFCDDFSRAIMTNSRAKSNPELVTLAFWLRRSQLNSIKEEFVKRKVCRLVVPRGLAFHVPPANVDTIFVYSWILSLLCGNKNIVRLSARASELSTLLIGIYANMVTQPKYTKIAETSLFVKFSHDDEIVQAISAACDLRVVWGGNETIKKIRTSTVHPRAIDLGFADRFSWATFKASSVNNLSDEELAKLAENFYNDSYLYNQKACSSPRVLTWIGDHSSVRTAKERFFSTLKRTIESKRSALDNSVSLYKIKNSFEWAAETRINRVDFYSAALTVGSVNSCDDISWIKSLDFGAGSFINLDVKDLNQMASFFQSDDQTLSYFGFEQHELVELAQVVNGKGIDRIVPVGQALNFSHHWDGLDLIEAMSKQVFIS